MISFVFEKFAQPNNFTRFFIYNQEDRTKLYVSKYAF